MELKKQMEDVRNAVGHLQICLNLLMHDKEQFIKEFGEDAYNAFAKCQRHITAFEAKAHNDKVWYLKD